MTKLFIADDTKPSKDCKSSGAVHWRRLAAQGRLQDLRHQQELTKEKALIAADMHDELGAALTQIAFLGEVAKGQSANESQTRSTLDRISEAARACIRHLAKGLKLQFTSRWTCYGHDSAQFLFIFS